MSRGERAVALGALASVVAALAAPTVAAEPNIRVTPPTARAGDVVLVEVTAPRGEESPGAPAGTAGGKPLRFFAVRGGYQALAAIPLEAPAGEMEVRVDGGQPVAVTVTERPPRQVLLEVEEEYVQPPPALRERIESDRKRVAQIFEAPWRDLTVRRPFVWPAARKLTGRFGDHRMFNGTLNSVHQGVDLAVPAGTPVRASNDGVVVLSGDLFYSGKTVLIDHGAGIYTGYFHLSSLDVEEGDEVRRGARLGRVGDTGRATAPHLHFAVRADGRYVDPQSFMKLRLRPPPAGDRIQQTARSR